MISKIIRTSLFLILFSCGKDYSKTCKTYECRKKSMIVELVPNSIYLGEVSQLRVRRIAFFLPKMRVFIGEYDENFNLPNGVEKQYFTGTDSLATMNLYPKTEGIKKVKGIIEEYQFISKDSIDSYRYYFEVELNVIDTVQSI